MGADARQGLRLVFVQQVYCGGTESRGGESAVPAQPRTGALPLEFVGDTLVTRSSGEIERFERQASLVSILRERVAPRA